MFLEHSFKTKTAKLKNRNSLFTVRIFSACSAIRIGQWELLKPKVAKTQISFWEV